MSGQNLAGVMWGMQASTWPDTQNVPFTDAVTRPMNVVVSLNEGLLPQRDNLTAVAAQKCWNDQILSIDSTVQTFCSLKRSSRYKVQQPKVQNENLALEWQRSDCCRTRSSLFPSRRGLICAFCSYFLKQNNKSSSLKVPWLERPFLLWLPGIRVVSVLDGGVKWANW